MGQREEQTGGDQGRRELGGFLGLPRSPHSWSEQGQEWRHSLRAYMGGGLLRHTQRLRVGRMDRPVLRGAGVTGDIKLQ